MTRDVEKRIAALESQKLDWISRLQFIDYLGLDDYDSGEWIERYREPTITVFENTETGEVRGVYLDRRSEDEILPEGGNPAYL